MTQREAITKCQEILRDNCENPATEMIVLGQVLVKMGETLSGFSTAECRAILTAVSCMTDIAASKPVEVTP